jgi:hypothetical protein
MMTARTTGGPPRRKKTSKGSGRPDLTKLDLVEERVEILDPALEAYCRADRVRGDVRCSVGGARATFAS